MGAKLYHSIHARGERVEDVLKEFEAKADAQNGEVIAQEGNSASEIIAKSSNGVVHTDLEDGEVDESESSAQAVNDVSQ